MKKTLLLATLAATLTASAQTVVTFEDLTLSPNTNYDGSDGLGGFTSNGITFPNTYDSQYHYWSAGFAYSNKTDVTTAGYTNSASSYAGSGAGSSANFAVNYGDVELTLDAPRIVSSVDLTNNTYAALSMKNGDSYGKQFGSLTDAAGEVDGTNGEDYFRLVIRGIDANAQLTGSVVFYLADFRFSNNLEDYIVSNWQTVDLTSLGTVSKLTFDFESSDVGSWGINTPVYFAMDNLSLGVVGTPVTSLTTGAIYPNPATDQFIVKGLSGAIQVTDATGAVVYDGVTEELSTISCADWKAGYYVVTVSGEQGVTRSSIVKN